MSVAIDRRKSRCRAFMGHFVRNFDRLSFGSEVVRRGQQTGRCWQPMRVAHTRHGALSWTGCFPHW